MMLMLENKKESVTFMNNKLSYRWTLGGMTFKFTFRATKDQARSGAACMSDAPKWLTVEGGRADPRGVPWVVSPLSTYRASLDSGVMLVLMLPPLSSSTLSSILEILQDFKVLGLEVVTHVCCSKFQYIALKEAKVVSKAKLNRFKFELSLDESMELRCGKVVILPDVLEQFRRCLIQRLAEPVTHARFRMDNELSALKQIVQEVFTLTVQENCVDGS